MATYVYNTIDGSLYLWGPSDNARTVITVDALALPGFAFKTGLLSLDDTHAWNAPTLSVVVIATQKTGLAPDLSDLPASITAKGFTPTRAAGGAGFYTTAWAQSQVQAFYTFMQPNWDRALLSLLWRYLQSKVTS